jgi:hypothetical protein
VAGANTPTNNEIIVRDSVTVTLSATPLASIAGFEILGIGGSTVAQGGRRHQHGEPGRQHHGGGETGIRRDRDASRYCRVNNLDITITSGNESSLTTMRSATRFSTFTDTAGNAPSFSYSTSAWTIVATNSGGLIMTSGDANFVARGTVATSAHIICSATNPVGILDLLPR